jgi:hypothetical protein
MSAADLLADGFDRIRDEVHAVLDGLSTEDLIFRADPAANSIAWLVWHLTRVQDDHIAAAAGLEQVWPEGWMQRAELPFPADETGYAQGPDLVALVRLPVDLLVGYHDATHAQTVSFVRAMRDADLTRVVDRSWNPPVTLGVRLVSVLSDDLQHVGQAAFVRGLLQRHRG